MMEKTSKIRLMGAIACLVVFVLGGFYGRYFIWSISPSASKDAKIKIAKILSLDDVDETTIENDIICHIDGDGKATVKYNGQTVYCAWLCKGVVYDNDAIEYYEIESEDFGCHMYAIRITEDQREITKKYNRIVKLMEVIDQTVSNCFALAVLTILYVFLLIIVVFMFVVFFDFEDEEKEKKNEEI